MPLRQPIPRQQSASRQASQATYFSLSDDGSSVHDMGVATDASLDDVAVSEQKPQFDPSLRLPSVM